MGRGSTLKIPAAEYTHASFLDYLRENHEKVFAEDERKKWLKVYAVLHNLRDWKRTLFGSTEIRGLGEVTEIRIKRDQDGDSREEIYYGVEFREGLLLFFTSAIQEGYEATLGVRIRRSRGVTEAWISPSLFQRVWQSILEKNGGYVYRFTSRRAALDDTPARLRPSYRRRFSYTGDDGTLVVKELQSEYGVTPESMYLRVDPTLVVQITNSGFYSAREISELALEILYDILATITDELLETKATSEQFRFGVENLSGDVSRPRVASITAGQIALRGRPLTSEAVKEFIVNAEDFSFLDRRLTEGSLGFSATVVDEVKGSVFDVSMSETEITMIPKYNTTFESFLSFLRATRDQLDEQATLNVWGSSRG